MMTRAGPPRRGAAANILTFMRITLRVTFKFGRINTVSAANALINMNSGKLFFVITSPARFNYWDTCGAEAILVHFATR